MRWQQPVPQPDGSMKLAAAEHPCPNGCGGHWKHPAAQAGRVVGAPTSTPAQRGGWAKESQKITGDAPAWLDDIDDLRQ